MSQRESRLSRKILKELRQHGGFWFKVWGSEHMMAGLPDLIGCYKGRFVAFEVKHPETRSNTSDRQVYVMGKIHDAEGVVEVVCNASEALLVLDMIDDMID